MTDAAKVGKYIQSLRKVRGLTQQQLAERLSLSYQAVSKWESGASLPDTSYLPDIAMILGTTADSLLSGGENVLKFEKRVSVKDIRAGVDALAMVGDLIGRDNTVFRGMVDGINSRMNIDVEEVFADSFLTECLVTELLIQNMAHGRYVDVSDIKSNLHHQKWIDTACEYAAKYGIK